MRWFDLGCAVFVATAGPLLAGCFKELPPPIVDASTSDTSSSSMTDEGSSIGSSSTTDGDITEGTSPPGPDPQGLFGCDAPLRCPLIDCSEGCDGSEAELLCALGLLRDRVDGPLEVRACEKNVCSVRRILVRGHGTEQAQHQSREENDPLALSPLTACVLMPSELFKQCIAAPDPACADPDTWLKPGCTSSILQCPGSSK